LQRFIQKCWTFSKKSFNVVLGTALFEYRFEKASCCDLLRGVVARFCHSPRGE
jgi:hypothetical protein